MAGFRRAILPQCDQIVTNFYDLFVALEDEFPRHAFLFLLTFDLILQPFAEVLNGVDDAQLANCLLLPHSNLCKSIHSQVHCVAPFRFLSYRQDSDTARFLS